MKTKSDVAKQVAKAKGAKAVAKKMGLKVVEVKIVPMTTADLRGTPEPGCFLDELNQAPKKVQRAVYKISVAHGKKLEKDLAQDRMECRCHSLLNRTWEAIGSDCLQINDGKAMKRLEVIDAVCGSGLVGGYPDTYGNDKEALEWLEKQPRKEQDRIIRKAFPFERYGY